MRSRSNKPRIIYGILFGMMGIFELLGTFSSQAHAQSYVFNEGTFATGKAPQAVVSGDFNRDGRLDLAVANSADNTVSILLGRHDGSFAAKVDYATGTKPTSIAVGDFNQDGRLDLAVTNSVDNTVSILLGNGDGTFQAHVDYRTGASPMSVATGDFNGDHHLDLAVANSADNTVSILLGNGHGVFDAHTDFPTGAQPTSVGVGDVDGDGKLDLAVANLVDNTVSILLGNGNGTFQAHSDFATGISPTSVATGDFNGDGKLDLAVANSGSGSDFGSVSVLLGKGNGTFQGHVDYRASIAPSALIVGDFNGDGKPDLAVADHAQCASACHCVIGGVTLLKGNGDGTFRFVNNYDAGLGVVSVTSGDFNGDGKPDLVIANNQSNTVTVLIGEGDLGFVTRHDYATGSFSDAVVTADFNRDGLADLAVLNENDSNVSILLGKGQGLFQKAVNYPVGIAPNSLAVADFNGDGKLDLVTTAFLGVTVLLGNGDGTFGSPVFYPTGPAPLMVVTGDFNGDGIVDLAVTDFQSNIVSILLGNGDGTFQPHADFAAGTNPNGLTVGDFNRDGRLDLAVSHYVTNATVSILLGNGNGTLQAPVSYPTAPPAATTTIVAADLNGDGKLDLVTSPSFDSSGCNSLISVFLGNGDGTFQPHVDYSTGPSIVANRVIAGDFNRDGKIDLALVGGPVSILPGNGDGTFDSLLANYYLPQPSGPFDTLGFALAMAAGDFAGNGGLDLAAVNVSFSSSQGSVSVFLNPPIIALFPSQISFGKQAVGTRSAARKVQLFNPGSVPLKISSIMVSGDFAETNTCPGSLQVGANCTVNLTFTPVGTGTRTGALTFVDNAPSSPQTVTLTGVGSAP